MKKAVTKKAEWEDFLEELFNPETKHQVDIPVLLSWLEDERAKQYQTYTRNAVAFCINKFMDEPGMTEQQKDFYRGVAMAYKTLMNLKATLERQVGTQETTKKQSQTVGSAGY